MKYKAQIKEQKCEKEVANTKHALEIAKLQKQLVEVNNRKNNLKRVFAFFERNYLDQEVVFENHVYYLVLTKGT